MTRGKSSRVPGIDAVRSRFEQWRQTRQGKARIPDELWAAAVALARRDGVNRTAAALHLDGGKLKRQMLEARTAPGHTAPSAFVEFMASGAPEYIIEIEARNAKLRIHSKGATVADLANLSRALWDFAA